MGPGSLLRKIPALVCILTLIACPGLFADLDDFGREVEKEKEKEPEDDAEDERPVFDSGDYPDSETDVGLGAIFYIFYPIFFWAAHNISTWYPPYPYAVSGYTIEYLPRSTGNTFGESEPYDARKRMKASFRVSGGFFYEGGDRGTTVAASASGRIFGILWPEFQYRWRGDDSGYLHSVRLGGVIPIVQTDPITIGVPMAAAVYRGSFKLTGFAVGVIVRSFPVRPISLEFRAGSVIDGNLTLWEAGARLSVYLNRVEFYTGYNGLYLFSRAIHSVDFGIGISI